MLVGDEVQELVANRRCANLGALEQRDDRDVHGLSHLNEAAAANSVRALFVFLHLLKGDADAKRKLFLREAGGQADRADIPTDELVDGFYIFFELFFSVLYSACSPRHS